MEPLKGKIVINTPPSEAAVATLKAFIPKAEFYGRTSLGSKRRSYIITVEDYNRCKELLKSMKYTKAREQPFLIKQTTNTTNEQDSNLPLL